MDEIKLIIKNNPFLRGMVRVIDLGCNFERPADVDDPRSDWEKIEDDWKHVGKDINTALDKYKSEYANVA